MRQGFHSVSTAIGENNQNYSGYRTNTSRLASIEIDRPLDKNSRSELSLGLNENLGAALNERFAFLD